jgi:hypothetical protein
MDSISETVYDIGFAVSSIQRTAKLRINNPLKRRFHTLTKAEFSETNLSQLLRLILNRFHQ